MVYDEKIVKRFWANVAICEHGQDCPVCCWPWLGVSTLGYGLLTVYDKERYAKEGIGVRNLRANRLTCEIATQALLSPGMWALHKCNFPLCCHYHPNHVYIGTPQENAYDTVRAGHHVSMINRESIARGERHYNWKGGITRKWIKGNGLKIKLLERDVLQIRHLAFAGFPLRTIARIFSVRDNYISEIVSCKKRRNVPRS